MIMNSTLFKNLRKTEFDILCTFDRYCKTNGITYSLYGGTLLGAVRHKGFIPWDDDIDVAMTRSEFTKFCRVWRNHSLEGYYLEYFEYDVHTQNSHAKIRKDGTMLLMRGEDENIGHHGIWIDIFILDKISKHFFNSRRTLWAGFEMLTLIKGNVIYQGESLIKRLIRQLVRTIPSGRRQLRLKSIVTYLRKNYSDISSDFYFCDMCTYSYLKKRYPCDTADSYTTLSFEEKEFPAFSNYHKILHIMYGAYMKLPPEKDRVCMHATSRIVF